MVMKEVDMNSAMREGMRRLASGVSVISTKTTAGARFAMTATSVTSLSAEPASLLVCINRNTSMYEAVKDGGAFCVNVLRFDQQEISNKCASGDQGEERFEVGDWQETADLPYLEGSLAVFVCDQEQAINYGTHRILIGAIKRVLVDDGDTIDPLVYLDGGYKTL